MQSDVTLVGGTTPPATLSAPKPTAKATTQVAHAPPAALAVSQSIPRPAGTGQTAAIAEAKVALSAEAAPTAVSQAERVLKPYGVNMLPEPPVEFSPEEMPDEA